MATLEDEGKIIKGEVKQILTEIRTAILSASTIRSTKHHRVGPQPPSVQMISAAAPEMARVQIIAPAARAPEPEPEHQAEPEPERGAFTHADRAT